MAVAFCAGPAPGAELGIASKAPPLKDLNWLKGDPKDFATLGDSKITIIEFWATWCGPCIESVPHLTRIQKEHADKGVRVVGVSQLDPGNSLEAVKQFIADQGNRLDYAIAFDAKSEVTDSYMAASGQSGIPTAYLVNRDGVIAWIGHPLEGMEDALGRILAGTYDLERAKKLYELDTRFESAMMEFNIDAMLEAADKGLSLDPDDARRWMQKFMVLADFRGDLEKARECARNALRLVANDPPKLASVALAMLAEGDLYGCNKLAGDALDKALADAPKDIDLRMTRFHALVADDKTKEALASASETVELLKGNPDRLGPFALQLASPAVRDFAGDLALHAVTLAIDADPREPLHHITRFRILHECRRDTDGAVDAGRQVIRLADDDPNLLNEFAWGLLTDESTAGKFNQLALEAAEQMRKANGGDGWTHLDTLALAKFENGAVEEAVTLQTQALEKCPDGPVRLEIERTLDRYRSAKGQ